MITYWTHEVVGINGKRRSLVIAPSATLEAALANAFKDVTYYIGVCGYKVALCFHELCLTCRGTGFIQRRVHGVTHASRCRVCKGNPIQQVIAETIWTVNDAVYLGVFDRETNDG